MSDLAMVDMRPRWRRRLADPVRRFRTRRFSWHAWFWYRVHRVFNDLCFGDPGPFGDWGHDHRSVMAAHRWLCRRWVPEWDRWRDRLNAG